MKVTKEEARIKSYGDEVEAYKIRVYYVKKRRNCGDNVYIDNVEQFFNKKDAYKLLDFLNSEVITVDKLNDSTYYVEEEFSIFNVTILYNNNFKKLEESGIEFEFVK